MTDVDCSQLISFSLGGHHENQSPDAPNKASTKMSLTPMKCRKLVVYEVSTLGGEKSWEFLPIPTSSMAPRGSREGKIQTQLRLASKRASKVGEQSKPNGTVCQDRSVGEIHQVCNMVHGRYI